MRFFKGKANESKSVPSSTAKVMVKPMPPRALKMANDPTGAWQITRATQGEPEILVDIESREANGVYACDDPDELKDKPEGSVRFVCISDTHSYESKTNMKGPTAFQGIPPGDVLIHCGDFTNVGRVEEVEAFARWFSSMPHKRKILIAGNHDLSLEPETYAATAKRFGPSKRGEAFDAAAASAKAREIVEAIPNCEYLHDSGTSVEGITIWGSPWQPEFCEWAFNLPRGEQCRAKWQQIPTGTDVVLTHGPPLGHGDECFPAKNRAGCVDLLDELQRRVKPKYHCFGHIHEGWGVTTDGVTRYVNASTCTFRYKPVNTPIVFDIEIPKQSASKAESAPAPAAEAEKAESAPAPAAEAEKAESAPAPAAEAEKAESAPASSAQAAGSAAGLDAAPQAAPIDV